jgi:mycofactocin precursor
MLALATEPATRMPKFAVASRRMATDDTISSATADAEDDGELIEDELIIEEISIDGMCGVY